MSNSFNVIYINIDTRAKGQFNVNANTISEAIEIANVSLQKLLGYKPYQVNIVEVRTVTGQLLWSKEGQ